MMCPYKLAHDVIGKEIEELMKKSEYMRDNNTEQLVKCIEVIILVILASCNKQYKRKRVNDDSYKQCRSVRPTMRILRGGGIHDADQREDMQLSLHNLNITHETRDIGSEWSFAQKLSPNIRIDKDGTGNLLFRRYGYGIMITKEEMDKCLSLIAESKTIETLYDNIEVQGLYQYSSDESEGTAGLGFCAILALVGTLSPHLNSREAMKTTKGRKEIADVIEEILIPSVRDYTQPDDFQVNLKAHEHVIYKDHTIEHLTNMVTILKHTNTREINEEQWMYAAEVGIVVQAMPTEVTYWQEILNGDWLALHLWSSVTTEFKRQTIHTLQKTLKTNTAHIGYAKSHFFNIGEIGVNRFQNIFLEVINAIVLTQDHDTRITLARRDNKTVIQPEELDEGCIATQKKDAQWFMSISKKRARELGRLVPSQIKEDLIKSSTYIQINKQIKHVNWSLIQGDSYCGYQALHAVAMHSEGRSHSEIASAIRTQEKPYKLIVFLQKQISRLQGQNMRNALNRVNEAIRRLKRGESIDRDSWCPTEMIDHILTSAYPQSNFWNHTRPPMGSSEWMTSYYNKEWLTSDPRLDIIFNGTDHYTIHLNIGIQERDLLTGIDNLVEIITNKNKLKIGWNEIHGKKMGQLRLELETINLNAMEEEVYQDVISKKNLRTQKNMGRTPSQAYSVTQCSEQHKYKQIKTNETIITPTPWLRIKTTMNYASTYHPLDDAIPPSQVLDIPFPKRSVRDETSMKELVIAASRIGKGMGVYTLISIPCDTIIMDYVDEAREVIQKEDVCNGIRDTTYMYANHKTNTYINASNNTHSYCGLVNEALEDKNFNTIICESKDSKGKVRVYYKTTRDITAREEIGTRYSIDGSYWDTSKVYSPEFLEKVRLCYQKVIPYQINSVESVEDIDQVDMRDITTPKKRSIDQLIDIYNAITPEDNTYRNRGKKETKDEENNPRTCDYHYQSPEGIKEVANYKHKMESEDESDKDVSDNEQDSDEEQYTHTTYNNKINNEMDTDDTSYTFCPIQQENTDMGNQWDLQCWEISRESTPMNGSNLHTIVAIPATMDANEYKQDRPISACTEDSMENIDQNQTTAGSISKKRIRPKDRSKRKRGKKKATGKDKEINQEHRNNVNEMSEYDLRQLSHEKLVEYILDQKCRHKKAIDKITKSGDHRKDSPSEFKKRALDAVSRIFNYNKSTKIIEPTTAQGKKHDLRHAIPLNYTEQLDNTSSVRKDCRKYHKVPLKPRYILNDSTVVNKDAFMVAVSNLKHNIQGVFAREDIPLKGNRKLFEYTSEHNYGTVVADKVSRYLAFKSDNKFVVNIGNVVVDATNNISSYCNHVQELLSHTTPFNCKYVRAGDCINIIQTSPIAKHEELNIQYSKDGGYWNNRQTGYPDEILKRARKYYDIPEPNNTKQQLKLNQEIPNYQSTPKSMEHKTEFNLMSKETLFRWSSDNEECNLRIATINMNGALYDTKNGEPTFVLQMMVQCGLNIVGMTDTRTPIDKVKNTVKSMKYPQPKGTAVICYPTIRSNKDTTRLTTMGGQMLIIDRQWEPWITDKRSDESGLSLIVSLGITFQHQMLVIIQVMVPPPSAGQFTMWSRVTKYLADKGIKKTPREYVLDTAAKWKINEISKGKKVIIMGDFNRTSNQLKQWQSDNDLQRAHEKIEIAQEHPGRELCTYLRNSTTRSHIDHIYHSDLGSLKVTSVGAIDHPHVHEKTDHFPIWIAISWKGYMATKYTHEPSPAIKNQPDLDLDNQTMVEDYANELDRYIETIGEISPNMTPEKAGCIQAAIYAKSAEIARGGVEIKFQTTRPKGFQHRYKDGFSPMFRIMQESLHAYINLGRVINRLQKRTHTATIRLKELQKIYPRWKKVYDQYYITSPKDHADAILFPLELQHVTLRGCRNINIAEKIAKLKARMHGRQRTILRVKLSERCKTMQHSISINKLKKVIQMIIPTDRTALDYAAINGPDGKPITMQMADIEANRTMENWMEVPENIHYISQEFEEDPERWKTLLNGSYKCPDTEVPNNVMQPVIEAFKAKEISAQTKSDLEKAMHTEFSFHEFNKSRKHLAKDKSPGPSGVTNNQMKSWNEKTAKAIYELSSIMWKYHSVPQFWQDRLMTLLPKVPGENNLAKVRPISLFENIRKLWAGMVSRRIQTIWNRDNLLHANQHGFRWQRGTHTAVIHLLNQLENADSFDPVYLTMWDIRRAFDSVPKWLQRLAWARLGLQTQDLEWFLRLDATGNIYVRTPEFEAKRKMRPAEDHLQKELSMINLASGNYFHPERGVGQGDTPSSLIFIAVFDILLTLLDTSGTGQPHAYADDLAHIAKTQADQQRHADLVSAFCLITGLEVATAKVEAIALNHGNLNFTTTLIIRDWWWIPHLVIQSDKDFWTRYLGIYLDTNMCKKHYEMATKQYRVSCNALIHRTAPSSAKKMVHTLCLRPKIRYVAALAPWNLKQYKQIDQIPYQLFCQIYGLRKGFPLALIYTPVNLGGCGDTKLSDEANSMKWKILHSCIHLGGLSKATSNALIQRALGRRNNGLQPRGFVDSLIEWCIEMGLELHKHKPTCISYPLLRLNQILTLQDPTSTIHVYTDGAYDTEKDTPLLDKLMSTPTQIRQQYGVGKSSVYIEGTLSNGVMNSIAMRLTSKTSASMSTTPFLHELIGIIVGTNISHNTMNSVRAHTDCKSALAKVRDIILPGSNSTLHLPYGPILSAIKTMTLNDYKIDWIESHPENKKRNKIWTDDDYGIYKADMIASRSMIDIRKSLPKTTVIQGDIEELLDSLIPAETWIWKTLEGVPMLESLRTRASQKAHTTYLNRRDTLRNKGDLMLPVRWNKYNMHLATFLNGSRQKCSTRIRGHQCKQMYDWTTHSVNLAKGVKTIDERAEQSKCRLCHTAKVENQVHTSTTCQHPELMYIRNIYKCEIESILTAFKHIKLPKRHWWIRHIMKYISQHIWGEDEVTADIWNGRWTRHMWEDALKNVEEKIKKEIDTKLCRKWLSQITTKLFETQSALSRHRFKLTKRLRNPMFERSQNIPAVIKKRIYEQYGIDPENNGSKKKKRKTNNEMTVKNKRKCYTSNKDQLPEKKSRVNIKRRHSASSTKETMHNKKENTLKTTKRDVIIANLRNKASKQWRKRKLSEEICEDRRPKRIQKITIKSWKKRLKTTFSRGRPHKLKYHCTGTTGHHRLQIKRGWHHYMRHKYHLIYKIGIKRKTENGTPPQLYKRQRESQSDIQIADIELRR